MYSLFQTNFIHILLVILPYIVMETHSKGLLYSIYQLEQMSRNHYDNQLRENPNAGSSVQQQYPTKALICRTFNRHQRKLCHQHFRLMDSVLSGFLLGLNECRYQFATHVWNCRGHNVTIEPPRSHRAQLDQPQQPPAPAASSSSSSSSSAGSSAKKSRKRRRRKKKTYLDKLLGRGTPESAYVLSVISAGVAHQVTKACSKGVHDSCGCDRTIYDTPESANFKWSGCSHNIHFGAAFTRQFLDISEKSRLTKSPQKALTNLHNNHVGRQAVVAKMAKKCKCHGVSGSCEMKTCIRALPDFRVVGNLLKQRFHQAMQVHFLNSRLIPRGFTGGKMFTDSDLIYLNLSPNFCHHDSRVGSLGTRGRQCIDEQTSAEYLSKPTEPSADLASSSSSSSASSSFALDLSSDSINGFGQPLPAGQCNELCCGRGFSRRRYTRMEQCRCKFQWCCDVRCDVCEKQVVESVCN